MARQRVIHPSIWSSDSFQALAERQRLLFIGLFSTADDFGRGRASAGNLKILLFPMDSVRVQEIGKDLETVSLARMVTLYDVDGKPYYELPRWWVYQNQRLDRLSKSTIPMPATQTKDLRDNAPGSGRANARRTPAEEKRSTAVQQRQATMVQPAVPHDSPKTGTITTPSAAKNATAGFTKAQFLAERRATAAATLYRQFAGEYKTFFKVAYPDNPAACVKLLKTTVRQTSASAAGKALELYWRDIRGSAVAEWQGKQPPAGGKVSPTVRAFVACLAGQMSKNGTGYRDLIEHDRTTDATAWSEHNRSLFT